MVSFMFVYPIPYWSIPENRLLQGDGRNVVDCFVQIWCTGCSAFPQQHLDGCSGCCQIPGQIGDTAAVFDFQHEWACVAGLREFLDESSPRERTFTWQQV